MTKARKNQMLIRVTIAIILAIVVGKFSQGVSIGGTDLVSIYDLCGQLFLNALMMIMVPLVASSIIAGIGGLTSDGSFGRLGLKTFFYYVLTVLIAILIGLGLVSMISFDHVKLDMSTLMNMAPVDIQLPSTGDALAKQVLFKVLPSNVFAAASQGNMLGIIFFSILFGFALSKIRGSSQEILLKFWQGMFAVMMKVTHMILVFLPLGVFFLVAKTVAHTGFQSIASVGLFVMVVLLGLAIFLFIALPILLFLRGASVSKYFRAVSPALITAFSTSSSAATLPVTMECVEKRAGVSNKVCSFVVPLGTSVNMTGSALYECVGVLFIAAMVGVDLSFLQQGLVIILSLLAAMGMAGIPSASLISLVVILNTLGLPPESIALVVPVERILDMFRTVVNVASEAGCAVMVARWEGEDVLPK
ncbi:MAG: dicarboxylate/amino acid:cation symporter [Chlamydiales bacterium]|nr:dicarboxylate/amino acid:cation symporter [Chlamydiales bacterium]